MIVRNKILGVTLIELMVSLVIVSILATVSSSFYGGYVQKSRRMDAVNHLLGYQLAQEKYRAHRVAYAQDFEKLIGSKKASIDSSEGHYTLSIENATSNTYRILAAPKGVQASDTECGTFALNQNGPDYSTNYANANCWNQ